MNDPGSQQPPVHEVQHILDTAGDRWMDIVIQHEHTLVSMARHFLLMTVQRSWRGPLAMIWPVENPHQ